MKKLLLLLIVITMSLSMGAAPASAGSAKKGISVANDYRSSGSALPNMGARWYYTWASTNRGVGAPGGAEFVPMIWGPGSVNDTELSNARRSGRTLLGFNEPDLSGQAAMSPEHALSLWPRLQATGMRLGAPAVAWGGDIPGGWLDRFMAVARARNLKVDFIPLHWYGGDFSANATRQLETYLRNVHNRYKKPIWLTEYALTDFSVNPPRYPTHQQQEAFVQASTRMLNGLSFVERYSWFTMSRSTAPTGLYNGTKPTMSGIHYRNA
jgi:hypothetical protein